MLTPERPKQLTTRLGSFTNEPRLSICDPVTLIQMVIALSFLLPDVCCVANVPSEVIFQDRAESPL